MNYSHYFDFTLMAKTVVEKKRKYFITRGNIFEIKEQTLKKRIRFKKTYHKSTFFPPVMVIKCIFF